MSNDMNGDERNGGADVQPMGEMPNEPAFEIDQRGLSAMDSGAERRRLPRVAVDEGLECQLEVRTKIRLVDISMSGALLASDAQLPIGTRAHLRAGVGPAPFAPEVQVKRQVDRGRETQTALGTVFLGMDDRSRKSLEEFLRKASE